MGGFFFFQISFPILVRCLAEAGRSLAWACAPTWAGGLQALKSKAGLLGSAGRVCAAGGGCGVLPEVPGQAGLKASLCCHSLFRTGSLIWNWPELIRWLQALPGRGALFVIVVIVIIIEDSMAGGLNLTFPFLHDFCSFAIDKIMVIYI